MHIELAIQVLVCSSSTSIDVCTRLARPADPGTNGKGRVRPQVALRMFNGVGDPPRAMEAGEQRVLSQKQ
jgi:hypothetical protein